MGEVICNMYWPRNFRSSHALPNADSLEAITSNSWAEGLSAAAGLQEPGQKGWGLPVGSKAYMS